MQLMIKEIALDPRLFAQWPHHKALRDAFGVEKGRVISAFPKKWRRHVREEVSRLEGLGEIGSVKAQSILQWLDVLPGTHEMRMVASKVGYDGSKGWHLNATDAWQSFDAILSAKKIETPNAILADEDQEYLRDPRFAAETRRPVQRRKKPIVDCVWPLLRGSKELRLVEPHFNPHKARFRDVLEALLDRLHAEESLIREIALHVRHPQDKNPNDLAPPSFTIEELKANLSPLLRTGWSLRVHLWTRGREKMHPRYLLTDRGGIQIDYGWDEGELDTETTPIMLLPHADWEREMRRYQPGSPDFTMDAVSDIVVIK
jgi:hypothetical protein